MSLTSSFESSLDLTRKYPTHRQTFSCFRTNATGYENNPNFNFYNFVSVFENFGKSLQNKCAAMKVQRCL